jgi:hypothetical protein
MLLPIISLRLRAHLFQGKPMNTSSAQTQEDSASESDNTWTQESDIRSLKDTEFDCIYIHQE